MRRLVAPVVVAGLAVLWLAGCGGRSDARVAATPAVADGPTAVDRLGRSVSFGRPPRRIVSLSPATTELLFAIGRGGSIVGATAHCDHPPEAARIARMGGGPLETISREAIVAVAPDAVFCLWDAHAPLVEPLTAAGIPVFAVGADRLEELFAEIGTLGRITAAEPAAAELVAAMRKRLAAVAGRVPRGRRPRAFYEVWADPLIAAAPRSFIGELLDLAGLDNVIDAAAPRYPRVSGETVVASDPEVILAPTAAGRGVESIAARPGWAAVTAVRERCIVLVDADTVSRCGPRILDALEAIIAAVHGATVATRPPAAPAEPSP